MIFVGVMECYHLSNNKVENLSLTVNKEQENDEFGSSVNSWPRKNLTFSEKYQEPLHAVENNRKTTKNLNKV